MITRKVIYDAPQEKFFEDVLTKRIADIMRKNFKEITGRTIPESEFNAWDHSLGEVKNLVELTKLTDLYFSFEYQVPYCQQRIDCLIFGKNSSGKGVVIHIELKAWQKVEPTDIEGNYVETYVGGTTRRVVHPSQQVEGYHNYLMGFVSVFEEKELDLYDCSYCHNYRKEIGEGLFNPRYREIMEKFPLYTREDVQQLAEKIKSLLSEGDGFSIFNKFMQSPIRPSKKLLENLSKVVVNDSGYTLLNDQILARNTILHSIKLAEDKGEKTVVIVKGGPGTGKTVIALHILIDYVTKNKNKGRHVFYSTKSKPLIEAIKNRVGDKARLLFTNLTPFVPSRIGENEIDLLIIDEAHRIGKSSNMQFTPAEHRTDMQQMEQLIRCAKTSVFFIDDKQVIRSLEIGSTDLIKETAKKYGCPVIEEELVSQFRCNGSDNYLDWLESVLGHSSEKRILKKQDNFDFRIFDSAQELYKTIKSKNDEPGMTARIVAGFCWPWTPKLDQNGDLVKDVKIDGFAMPWETHDKISRPPAGYVRWYEWAYKPEGIKQVGCIYTAQGFEFDYVGVIVGPDLRYDKGKDQLTGDVTKTQDPVLRRNKESFTEYARNIYRVLMSRGLKGCYVYFVDKDTEKFFRARIEKDRGHA